MSTSPRPRFFGFDVHHQYVMIAAVDQRQTVLFPPRKVKREELRAWMDAHVQPIDQVALEASGSVWPLVDRLQARVERVVVAHASDVKLIASSLVKTDKRDALVLARLLAADLLPAIWIPPEPVRQLRSLISHRQQIRKQRQAALNRMRNLLKQWELQPPTNAIDTPAARLWWEALTLNPTQRLLVSQNLQLLKDLATMLADIERELARLSTASPWQDQLAFLIQLPGIGLLNAMTILSAIGDIARFPTPKHLVGYSGLGARVHQSGHTHHTGGITHRGRPELRTALVEAAWSAVNFNPHWKPLFQPLAARLGRSKAIIVIARKLLVAVWHVWSKQAADRHADADAVARSLMHWASSHRVATAQGLRRTAFVRRELNRLGLGYDLEQVRYGGRQHALPPPPTVSVSV